MIKKISFVLLILLLLSLIASPIDATDENIKSLALGDNLRSNPIITIQPNETAIQPNMIPGIEYIIPVNLTYKIEGIFAKMMGNLLTNKKANIDLKVTSNNPECTVKIAPDSVTADISINEKEIDESVSVSVSLSAKAKATDKVTININATANEVKGLLNIIKWINQKTFSKDFSITIGYKPDISITPDNNSYEISPINITNTTINIKNNGNGKTTVLVNITEEPVGWNIIIPKTIDLETGEDIDINLTVKPLKNFNQDFINITFTPFYYTEVPSEDTTNSETIYRSYEYKNDGSYKEEKKDNGFEIDSTILLIIIIIVLAIILVLIGFKLKKR